ncbi:MAG: galactose mutarotase [Spirochaetales bacterium]|nr:galactose mutarotase [Spirochaetales bacterium]
MKLSQRAVHLGGREVQEFTLANDRGTELVCLNLGCTVTRLLAPDRHGHRENILFGFHQQEQYAHNTPYFGAVVGRVAGRIQGAGFSLRGRAYSLEKNDGENTLHSGSQNFTTALWNAYPEVRSQEVSVHFRHFSPDGEGGFPGNVNIEVVYTLDNTDAWTITYRATSDQTTPLNPTHHAYFNLSGETIENHLLNLHSDRFLELDGQAIPTGKLLPVEGTVFDFRTARALKSGLTSEHPQIHKVNGGYDHPFVLTTRFAREAVLSDPTSGRVLVVDTDAPSLVVYTGNHLPEKHRAICLEAQGFPDAVHHEAFPSVLVEAGREWVSRTRYTLETLM